MLWTASCLGVQPRHGRSFSADEAAERRRLAVIRTSCRRASSTAVVFVLLIAAANTFTPTSSPMEPRFRGIAAASRMRARGSFRAGVNALCPPNRSPCREWSR